MNPKPTKAELREAVRQLVASGDLIETKEIDLETGTARSRYFHRDYAPKQT